MTQYMREIVIIDEEKCDGCGECVPSCAEGAIQIIDGKAKLVADNLCDGLGNCLGVCPKGAITIEKRSSDEFDEAAVEVHLASMKSPETACPAPAEQTTEPTMACGCPGTLARKLAPSETGTDAANTSSPGAAMPSRLGHWPVQLMLVPAVAPMWENANILIAADCVVVAMPDFHERLLKGRNVAIGCPKFDDLAHYENKMTEIFKNNSIQSVTVAQMEVPCCNGIVTAVRNAWINSGKTDLKLTIMMISVQGKVMQESTLP